MNESAAPPSQKDLFIVLGSFILIFIAIDKVAAFYASSDLTTGFWAAAIVAITALFAVEILVFKRSPSAAFQFLGFGRPDGRTLLVTAIIAAISLLFFPIFSSITGAAVSTPDGLALETLGYCRHSWGCGRGVVSRLFVSAFSFRQNVQPGGFFFAAGICSRAHLSFYLYAGAIGVVRNCARFGFRLPVCLFV